MLKRVGLLLTLGGFFGNPEETNQRDPCLNSRVQSLEPRNSGVPDVNLGRSSPSLLNGVVYGRRVLPNLTLGMPNACGCRTLKLELGLSQQVGPGRCFENKTARVLC